jgi:2-dehydro-3-deoxygluconokinase
MRPVPRIRAIGEAMVELAPVGDGLFRQSFAGDVFNTAWAMARWLGPGADVGLVTRLGQDRLSDAFAAQMAADGLALDGVGRDPTRTMGLYLIDLDGVERSFHYWRGQSAARGLADDPAALARALQGVGLIHLSGITLAILPPDGRAALFAALAQARAKGALIAFDPNLRQRLWPDAEEMRATVTRMLGLADIALPSLDDETAQFGDRDAAATLDRLTAAGVAEIVVKDGPGPLRLRVGGRDLTVPTPPVEGVRDTSGAGDAFNAGYLAARVLGHAPEVAVRSGQALAAVTLRSFGARAAAADLAALARP